MKSLKHVAEAFNQEEASYALRNFLDAFYASPNFEAIEEEPRLTAQIFNDEGHSDAYLAAVAEHLARHHHLPLPSWSLNPSRFLKKPHFGAKTFKLKRLLLADSPAAFRSRNLFVSADALTRA
ncbi:MAG: hypothetical protein HC904_06015 [Blastochloris sp.]|nr:hypothetical protein [Blastochloris sp.]